MKSIIYSVTKEELQNFINESTTYGQVLKHFGLENKGGNHNTLKRRIKEEGLDVSSIVKFKFKGGWNKGIKGFNLRRMSLEDAMKTIFITNSTSYQAAAKKYVKMYNLMEYKCSECGLTNEWNGKPITLELDHTDGNSHNNILTNLKWLCPNCHSQTPTFRGRNRKIRYYCVDCKKEILKESTRCKSCAAKQQPKKVERPAKEKLEELIKILPMTHIGKMYGVSGNSIKSWCKSYGIIR